MLNTPVQMASPYYSQVQYAAPQLKVVPNQQPNIQQTNCNEQVMAISYDIAAEYGAIGKINNIIADVAKELKSEEDPDRKKILEARISTLNNMVLQRENRLNQMEQSLNTIKHSCNN